MDRRESGSFHFALCRFGRKLPVKEEDCFLVNSSRNVVAIEDHTGVIHLACLHSGQILEKFLLDSQISLKRFYWQKDGHYPTSTTEPGHARCVSWVHNELVIYDVMVSTDAGISTECVLECNRENIAAVLDRANVEVTKDPPQIIQYQGSTITLQYGTSLLRLSLYHGHPPRLDCSFQVARQPSGVQCMKCIQRELLMVVTCDGLVSFWSFSRAKRVAFIDLNHLLRYGPGQENDPNDLHITVTADLSHMCVASSKPCIHVIKLNVYFQQNPGHLLDAHLHDKGTFQHVFSSTSLETGSWSQGQRPLSPSPRTKPTWNTKIVPLQSRTPAVHKPWHEAVGLKSLYSRHSTPNCSGPRSKSRTTGFRSQTGEGPQDEGCHAIPMTTLSLPENLSDIRLREAQCAYSTAHLCFVRKRILPTEGSEVIVCAVDLENGSIWQHKVPEHSVVMLPDGGSHPVLLLTEEAVYGVSFGVAQEQIVSKMMLYDTAAGADAVCHLNQWDRCSVPLHALEVGLKHRQLDTVAFFLKSREQVFSLAKPDSPPTSAKEVKVTGHDLGYSDTDIQQLELAVELLSKTIAEIISDKQSRQFAEQLLHITLDYLHKVTKNVVSKLSAAKLSGCSTEQFEADTENLLTKLTDYVVDLRGHLKDTNARLSQGQAMGRLVLEAEGGLAEFGTSSSQQALLVVWRTLDEKAAIVEGILGGQLPLLQAYLRDAYGGATSDLGHIISIGLEEALVYLHEKEMKYAEQLFTNMGFDVVTKLRQVCLYTPDKALRDYLATDLTRRGQLSTEELQMVEYVHKLETVYSCPSFEMAKVLRTEGVTSNWEKRLDLESALPRSSRTLDIVEHCGDISPGEVLNTETTNYAHILLEWLRSWDLETRHRILLEPALCKNASETSCRNQVPAAVIWGYLCSHLDLTRLLEWVRSQHPTTGSVCAASPTWPYNHSITAQMLDQLSGCTQFVRNTVLDELARQGIFSGLEQDSLRSIVARLGRCHAVMQTPHPLEVTSQTNGVNLVDLHGHMIQMCMQHNLPQLLYFYLDHWSLCVSSTDLSEVGMAQAEVPAWVDMLLHFRLAAYRLLDPASVFEASLSASRFVQKLNKTCIADMIEDGLVGRALATMMYNPAVLQDLIANPPCQMTEALKSIPRLRQALLMPGESELSAKQDITMYQLLQGNVNFDLTRLFGWQSMNTVATEEAPEELPHFSQERLVSRFAHCESLQYTYYLRQARPCFAFCSFLLMQWQNGAKNLSSKRVQNACLRAHSLAIRHFHQAFITAACSVFVELLGQDSTVLRLHVQTANQIFCHRSSQLLGSLEQRRQAEAALERSIAFMLEGCLLNRASEVGQCAEQLDSAIAWDINRHKLIRTCFQASQQWSLAVMFCSHHQVALSTSFLQACVAEDDWFMFLMFAQLHQYPAEQLKCLLPQFPSTHLQEHLYYVLDNVQHEERERQAASAATADRVPEQGQHIRAQLYARIGLQGAGKDAECSSSDEDTDSPPGDSQEQTDAIIPEESENYMPDLSQCRDLFSLVFACQNTACPWKAVCASAVRLRNPVLAAVATCHQDADILQCLCCWLLSSLPEHPHSELLSQLPADLHKHQCSLHDLDSILDSILSHCSVRILQDGLQIFDPKCILIDFLEFYTMVQKYGAREDCVDLAREFKSQYQKLLSPSAETPQSMLPRDWVESAIDRMIRHMLAHCPSPSMVYRFLQTLEQSGVARIIQTPDISLLHRLHKIVDQIQTGIRLDHPALSDPAGPAYQPECCRILELLQERHLYQEARVFAEVSRVPDVGITVRQLLHELRGLKQSGVWDHGDTQNTFWKHCQDTLNKHRVPATVAAQFFQDQSEQCQVSSGRCQLYKLAYDWLVQDKTAHDDTALRHVFTQLWKSHIQDFLETQQPSSPEGLHPVSLAEKWGSGAQPLIIASQLLHCDLTKIEDPVKLSAEEQTVLDVLVGQMLDRAELAEACQVAVHFNHFSQDLLIIVSCMKLALGRLRPDHLDVPLKRLLSSPRQLRTRKFSKTFVALPRIGSTMSLSSQLMESEGTEDEDNILCTLQAISQHCSSGRTCCTYIITVYKIAQILQKAVEEILQEDPFQVLHTVLASGHPQIYVLTKSYITASGLPDAQVAGFLCDGIVEALQVHGGITLPGSTHSPRGRGLILESPADPDAHCSGMTGLIQLCKDPSVLGQRLLDTACSLVSSNLEASHKRSTHSPRGRGLILESPADPDAHCSGMTGLIQLCKDPSVLGQRLLDTACSLVSSNLEASHKMLAVEVELLIYAHDCHTLACHMEGISAVLRAARTVTTGLAQMEEYVLMVRLLTGIARFSEMTYIFDILKQQEQFELLFRKGIEKEDKLRLAVLDYLKHYHPTDTDTYTMVSLAFTMFREIAQMLEESAHRQLSLLKGKALDNSPDVQSTLKTAVQNFSDAAESYAKEDCLRHAQVCVRHARLVALQIHLLPSRTRVINLDREQLRTLGLTHGKFYEIYIVCEAYGVHSLWPELLHKFVVQSGDFKYLHDFRQHVGLTATLISEVADRYRAQTQSSRQSSANMKKLLSLSNDVQMTYRLASRLGFADLVKDLLQGDSGAYLKDTCVTVKQTSR